MTLGLLADLHLVSDRHRNTTVEHTLGRLRERELPADWLAIAGDLTDNGAEGEYAEALRLLMPWRGRIMLAPGNHDGSVLGLFVQFAARRRWSRLCRALAAPVEAELSGWLVRSYDSCLLTSSPLDLARGRMGRAQLGRIPGHLARARARGLRPAILQHHWPYCRDEDLLLVDAAAELRLVEGRADLWAGHTHRAEVRDVAGSVLRCLGAACEGAEVVSIGG